ncbi:MAG: hypothetical protein MJ094_04885 [Saccharofermentans sp.]|nr:hypothetical protein [Saccharofermentans sp.]
MGFNCLTGQEEIKSRLRTLTNRGNSGSLLFTGTEGIGKHLFARETAKAFLCQNKTSDGACNECASCKYIDAGTHPDYVVVEPTEGRKNIRIADLREIVRDAEVKPQISSTKVIVINADKISFDCQNLLLKTLEEPSDHLVYILLCSDMSKLLQTILSRVTELPMKAYTDEEMERILLSNSSETIADDKIKFFSSFSSNIPGKALALMGDSEFMEERDYIFDLIMRMPRIRYTDILSDEFKFFNDNKGRIDELLLLMIWTLGDVASLIGSPSPSNIKNIDRKDELVRFVTENGGITLQNISNAERSIMEYIKNSKINATFEVACCNMLLSIYKELTDEKNG